MSDLNKNQKLLLYIVQACNGIDEKVKLAKLQYFIDFIHFAFNDIPVSEEDIVYNRQKFGPLSVTFNTDLDILKAKGYLEEKPRFKFRVTKQPTYGFTEKEKKTISYVLEKYKNLSYRELAILSHKQFPYQSAEDNGVVNLFTAYNLVDEYPDYGI